MARIREIKKYGDSRAIKLEPSDLVDLGIKEGDTVDIEDLVFYNGEMSSDKMKLVQYTAQKIRDKDGDVLLTKFTQLYK